ncbi:MAG: hypothetical protein FJ314_04250, partial [SAR202 cluster bacterium]|nr:hypothetical protein [SAR202 cluster bacterium]
MAAVGKMHFYPWEARHGFQYRVACEGKRWLRVKDGYCYYLDRNGHLELHGSEHDGYLENHGAVIHRLPCASSWDHFFGMEACQFVDTHACYEPFALMAGLPGPHCPTTHRRTSLATDSTRPRCPTRFPAAGRSRSWAEQAWTTTGARGMAPATPSSGRRRRR